MNHKLEQFLRNENWDIILVDLGASGDEWETHIMFKQFADVLRFDADQREIKTFHSPQGRKITTINKAVIDTDDAETTFFLTKFPYCSSTLKPDFDKLKSFTYVDWFELEKEMSIPAIKLGKGLLESSFSRIDWLKLDTQGTELRILASLDENVLRGISACEIEASLYQHYKEADIMPEIHRFMLERNFWIADTVPHWNSRVSKDGYNHILQLIPEKDRKFYQFSRPKQVTTYELFYLKTIEGAVKDGYDYKEFLTLLVCHFAIGSYEYCIDILSEMKNRFPEKSEDLSTLSVIVDEQIKAIVRNTKKKYYLEAVFSRVKRFLLK